MFLLSVAAVGCGAVGPYRAYSVDQLPAYSVTALERSQYKHQEWLNRYVDAMRFAQVDRKVIVKGLSVSLLGSNRVLTKLPFTSAARWAVPVV